MGMGMDLYKFELMRNKILKEIENNNKKLKDKNRAILEFERQIRSYTNDLNSSNISQTEDRREFIGNIESLENQIIEFKKEIKELIEKENQLKRMLNKIEVLKKNIKESDNNAVLIKKLSEKLDSLEKTA